jgi:class 3 adenylate cyclase
VAAPEPREPITPPLLPGRYDGTIVLADISGYTRFLDDVRSAHLDDAFADGRTPEAYTLMSSLLDGIASAVDPPFTLVKFEGDAVFAVGRDGVAPRGAAMLDCVMACYRDFVARRDEEGVTWTTCTCGACSRRGTLELKFVVHHGEFFVQPVGTHVDVLGPDVIVAHRLLKNGAADLVGSSAYGLFTEAVTNALALPLSDAMISTESVDGVEITARVVPLAVIRA